MEKHLLKQENRRYRPFLILLFGCLATLGTAVALTETNGARWPVAVSLWVLALAGGVVWYIYSPLFKKRFSRKDLILLLFVAGFLLRAFYILYSVYSAHQHDLWHFHEFRSAASHDYRHAEYIEWFYRNLSLPTVAPANLRQFYHPPLHHIIAGLFMRLLTALGLQFGTLPECLQVLTLFYSCGCMIAGYDLFRRLGLQKLPLFCATALLCFAPSFILLSGSLNNDILSVFLAFCALDVAVIWYQKQTFGNIILLAFCIGFAMMAKLSAGLIAPAVALLFLVALIRKIRQPDHLKEFAAYLLQFVVFGVICVPLGLWWQGRNAVLFGISPTYVPSLLHSDPQFIGDVPLMTRLFGLNREVFTDMFVHFPDKTGGLRETNLIVAFLKTALFDEIRFFEDSGGLLGTVGKISCFALFYSFVGVCICSVVGAVRFFVRKDRIRESAAPAWMLLVLFFFPVGNYCLFCVRYPFVCTMNFRYCIPVLIPLFFFAAKSVEYGKKARFLPLLLMAVCCFSAAAVYTLFGFC